MILRRFTASMKKQDWTAIAIELVVVMVGVFIGLQASNWNDNQQTDAKSEQFTENLKADMRTEDWGYEFDIHYDENVRSTAMRALNALTGAAPLSDEDLLVNAFRATQYNDNIRQRATYDELTSTGSMGLIRDKSLRNAATQLYTSTLFDTIAQEGLNSPYRRAFRMAIPIDVQHTLDAKCGDLITVVGDYHTHFTHPLDYPCSTGLSPAVIKASASILRSNPDFIPMLRLRVTDIETNITNLMVYGKPVRQSLRAIAKEPQ